jgi:hypothetical protein
MSDEKQALKESSRGQQLFGPIGVTNAYSRSFAYFLDP